jgi:hypothetical protein
MPLRTRRHFFKNLFPDGYLQASLERIGRYSPFLQMALESPHPLP